MFRLQALDAQARVEKANAEFRARREAENAKLEEV